jgi:hypothetical protein
MRIRSLFSVCAVAAGAVALAVAVSANPARASTVTDVISFSDKGTYATNGDPAYGYQGSAIASGSFDITFDPTHLYLTQSITCVISNLTYSVTDPFFSPSTLMLDSITSFAFDGAGTLKLYSDAALGTAIVGSPNITIGINGWAYGPASSVWYSQNSFFGETLTTSGSVSIDDVSQTPLPAALPLFVTGLGAMGLFGWCRKRKNKAAIAAA